MNDFKHIRNHGPRRVYELRVPWHEYEERLLVELTPCEVSYEKYRLGWQWSKRTDFDKTLKTFWYVDVEFHAVNGTVWRAYDPTVYSVPGRYVNRYEWFIEATEENADKILDEIQRMYENNIVRIEAPADYFERVA